MSTPAPRDGNFVTGALFHIDGAAADQVMPGQINQSTGRVLVDFGGAGVGTVTTVSVVTANGFSGTVANPTTTPAITLMTTITGMLKGNGTAISAGAAGDVDTILPTQTGNSGKFLTTNGTVSSWGSPVAAAGGLNAQVQYNNSGALGGITGATTDGTSVSLSGAHLLNPTINGAGAGLATLAYPNTASSPTITLPTVTGTLATLAGTEVFTNKDLTSGTNTFPTFNQNTSGSAATLTTARTIGIVTGDGTSAGSSFNGSANNTNALTLATVNGNVGSFGSATQVAAFTVNAKGLTTAASNITITPAVGSITGLGTGIATFLATPSSANLAAAITDETGTGALVFAVAPALTGISTADLIAPNQNTITVTSNAGSASQSFLLNKFTNSSAATMTITIPVATPTPKDGQFLEVRIYDFSAVAQTIAWVNTENSATSAPTTSNGSTTLPLSVLFQYNAATSKWRCVAST